MIVGERPPRRLLLIIVGTADADIAAGQLARELRAAGVPCVVTAPMGCEVAADLRIPSRGSGFNRRAWLRRVYPQVVLGADTSRFTRRTLLAARSEGLTSLLWSASGQSLAWWLRLRYRCVPRLETPQARPLASYLRSRILDLTPGSDRLPARKRPRRRKVEYAF